MLFSITWTRSSKSEVMLALDWRRGLQFRLCATQRQLVRVSYVQEGVPKGIYFHRYCVKSGFHNYTVLVFFPMIFMNFDGL